MIRWWARGFFHTKTKLHAFQMTSGLASGKRAKKAFCGFRMRSASCQSPDIPDMKDCCKNCRRLLGNS